MPEELIALEPEFNEVTEQALNNLRQILTACGVDVENFEGVADSELTPLELENIMGKVWPLVGRAASIEEEWKKKLETREREKEAIYAAAYSAACEQMEPRSTETAKKNWIIQNRPEVTDLERLIGQARYIVGMVRASVKALDIRCKMLQSINRLKTTEMSVNLSGDGA